MQKTAYGCGMSVSMTKNTARCCEPKWFRWLPGKTTFLVMKLSILLLTISCFAANASTVGQRLSLSDNAITFKEIFAAIEKQTGYVVFAHRDVLDDGRRIKVAIRSLPIEVALDSIFKNEPINWTLEGKTIFLSPKKPVAQKKLMDFAARDLYEPSRFLIKILVRDSLGSPLAGATIINRNTKYSAVTNGQGEGSLDVQIDDLLDISYIGFEKITHRVGSSDATLSFVLRAASSPLDEIKVIAYGTTTERRNVGAVTTVKSETIARQPVANVLQALQSNVTGLVINQLDGRAGSGFSIQIRGVNSLTSGSAPLYLVDGVQVSGDDRFIYGTNPFNSIGPQNIESVSVLKDADATAIYGSRGANGVILITTKRGKSGATRVAMDISAGFSTYTKAAKMVSTAQYLEMRNEAFANDGEIPDEFTAQDLFGYGIGSDVNRYTDWQQELMGHNASVGSTQISVSGGSAQTSFFFGAGFRRETPPLPGSDFFFQRPTINMSINHRSTDDRFRMEAGVNYTDAKSNYAQEDVSYFLSYLPPNLPSLKNDDGSFNFIGFYNPYASFAQTMRFNEKNLIAHLNFSYLLAKGLTLKTTWGYTDVHKKTVSLNPLKTYSPDQGYSSGTGVFINVNLNSWQAEPQLEYTGTVGPGQLTAMVGATYQQLISDDHTISALDYSSEATLDNFATAATITATPYYSNYRYAAVFTRLNYIVDKKYIVNITARRDGSSRFGPGRQFGNFGAAGLGWVFSEEEMISRRLPALSFGKIRMSAGVTGNDQIGDYGYLDTYGPTSITGTIATFYGFSYNGISSLSPTALYNPDYGWESTRKYEAGLDLGFFKDRILIGLSRYIHRSSSQLLNYTLAPTAGFPGILRNLPALVGNTGWELSIGTTNISHGQFTWNTALNVTVPRNKLLEFPGLELSSYANRFVLGQPLSVQKVFNYMGVDPERGIYVFLDSEGKPTSQPTPGIDQTASVNLDRRYYGGFTNTLRYGSVQLVIDLQFVKQLNIDPTVSFTPAGAMGNYVTSVMDRWQKAGDVSTIQRFTQNTGTDAYLAGYYATMSKRLYVDGTYARVKNVSLSVNAGKRLLQRINSSAVRFYVNAQNLFTVTKFKGNDPEMLGLGSLPPMRTIVAGVQCSF